MEKKKLDALRSVANRKIQKIAEALGIDFTHRYQYIHAPCPVHRGNRQDAWSWHLDLGVWQCFSRGCHSEFGKDVFGLVKGVLDVKFPQAVDFVYKVCSVDGKIDLDALAAEADNKEFVKRIKKREPIYYGEDTLNRLIYHEYLEGRGFPRDLIESYHIGITREQYKEMSNRVIFPVRDINGAIVGFTGRTLFQDWKQRKISKWHHSKGFASKENLFNIDRALTHIKETGQAIICEGPIDVLRLEQAGIHNGVAIFGRELHNEQIGLLLKAGVQRLVLALDSDNAGSTGTENAIGAAKSFFSIEVVDIPKKDVGELTVDEVREKFCVQNLRN